MTLPNYQLLEELHAGAHANVYRALETKTSKHVIVKIAHRTSTAILSHEFDIGAILRLDGVIHHYHLERSAGGVAVVMEDFGGQSLRSVMDEHRCDLDEVLRIGIQIARAIREIHRKNVIHMDVNPSNCLINLHTGELKICDFGISTILDRENILSTSSGTFQGTLAYLSPEQTGRMNRAVDYRTDFYSFGVTLYEMLIGRTPFQSSDPLELIHHHIAKRATPPHDLNNSIPITVSNIVMKLLAKTAEERYQSAFGIIEDLERCHRSLGARGKIEVFELATKDVSSKFFIPETLYGREEQIRTLHETFEQSRNGGRAAVFVTGESGIGKSSLVFELQQAIVRHKGYFTTGKCDQFKHHVPYASLILAFRELVQLILTESEERVASWRKLLHETLGPNGKVITDVVPEVEFIIGQQQSVEELSASEARNRFTIAFRDFIRCFPSHEHPLVLFIDDLQWIDIESIDLIESFLNDDDTQCLFFIGAYRDEEVPLGHPLLEMIKGLEESNISVTHIAVRQFDSATINALLADTLRCERTRSKTLADLIYRKTDGNPAFVIEFIKLLHREGALTFDASKREWVWDVDAIFKMNITDNVVELMRGKLRQLPERTRDILKWAACIGNTFKLDTLALVAGSSPMRTAQDLWEALRQGMVIPVGDAYKFIYDESQNEESGMLEAPARFGNIQYRFSHDQVQRAAYELIPPNETATIHLRIGRVLLKKTSPEEQEEDLFSIINQINDATELITDSTERLKYAGLNLQAARRAKSSNAADTALRYCVHGTTFLPDNSWETAPELAADLTYERAECEYAKGNLSRAEELYDAILERSRDVYMQAKVHFAKVQFYTHVGKWDNAVSDGVRGLKLLGTSLPLKPGKLSVFGLLIRVRLMRGRRPIPELAKAPEMTNPRALLTLGILDNLMSAAYCTSEELAGATILMMNSVTLKSGISAFASSVFSLYGLFIGAGLGQFEKAYQFGLIAQEIGERFNRPYLRGRLHLTFSIAISPWQKHLKESVAILQQGARFSREGGDLMYMAYNYGYAVLVEFAIGSELQSLIKRAEELLTFNTPPDKKSVISTIFTQYFFVYARQMAKNLVGQTKEFGSLEDDSFNSDEYLKELEAGKHTAAITYLGIAHMQAFCFAGRFSEGAELALNSQKLEHAAFGLYYDPELRFYASLLLAIHYRDATPGLRKKYKALIARNQKRMKKWAAACPENFFHKYALVEAEMAAYRGADEEAIRWYTQAINSSRENGFIHLEAFASERAARFFDRKGFAEISAGHLRRAYSGYVAWGAKAVADCLAAEDPALAVENEVAHKDETATITTTTTIQTKSYALDYESVLKASRALSGEIVLDKLIVRLVQIILENAGAQKGVLVLERNGELRLEAIGIADTGRVDILPGIPLENARRAEETHIVPGTIVSYVARTQEPVLLNNATREGRFISDPYIAAVKPVSVLCLPLINQTRLSGVLYLENNLAERAFTTERIDLLNVLCTQAAVSLANARLYLQLEDYSKTLEVKVEQRTRDLQQKSEELARNNIELESEKERSNHLLHNILPVEVARELMERGTTTPTRFESVTVVMTDFKDFTRSASELTPNELVNELNEVFCAFDDIVLRHGLEKVKTIGDAYMFAGGIPHPVPGHPVTCVRAATEMLLYLERRNARAPQRWDMRIGIHTGPIVAGVVGKQKFTYDMWGDTVNIASRMESFGEPGRINLSAATFQEIKNEITCEPRGKMPVKGIGEIEMYFVATAKRTKLET